MYGFVHSSAEALQQLLYRKGERDFESGVLPALVRPGYSGRSEPPQPRQADLTIVEISSGKDCRAGDVAIQSNYLETYFSDFFAPGERERRSAAFWELAREGDQAQLKAFLEADQVYRRYGRQDQALLASISVRSQEYDDLLADMQAITDLVGKSRLMFVTHVNAGGADGALIGPRDKHIRWVKQAAGVVGVECLDPTALMRTFGQEKAMERGGKDTTHYTNAFCDRLYALMHRQYVLPITGIEGGAEIAGEFEDALLSDTLSAAIEANFYEGARLLFAAIKANRDHPVLQMLRGQVLASIGDYESASPLLTARIDDPEMTQGMRKAAMRVLLETGDPVGALSIANQLMSDEYEDVEIYEVAGLAAERLDRQSEAANYRKLAFRLSPANPATAISVLEYYKTAGEDEQGAAWLNELLELLDSHEHAALARALAEWAISARDEVAVASALIVLARYDLARYDATVFTTLLREALGAGLQTAVAPAVAAVANMPDLSDRILTALRGVVSEWVHAAKALMSEGRLKDAYITAAACAAVSPDNKAAFRFKHVALHALSVKVKEAVKAQDDAAVIELCVEAGDMACYRSDTGLFFVRALTKRGRLAEAQAAAQILYDALPGNMDCRACLAHAADLNGDLLTAMTVYTELNEESPDSTARYRLRIDRFMAKAHKAGILHVRALVTEGRFADAVQLCHLLEAEAKDQRIANEKLRLLALGRVRLHQIDAQDDSDEALELLQLMLTLAPLDPLILRSAALEATKREKFEMGLDLWKRLNEIEPGLNITERQIRRCEIMVRRDGLEQRRKATPPSVAAHAPAKVAAGVSA